MGIRADLKALGGTSTTLIDNKIEFRKGHGDDDNLLDDCRTHVDEAGDTEETHNATKQPNTNSLALLSPRVTSLGRVRIKQADGSLRTYNTETGEYEN